MGVSTDGILCFGFLFEEGTEFPWDSSEEKEESWWLEVCGYEPPFQIYTSKGDYLGGKRPSEKKMDEYWQHEKKFLEQNSPPFELVNYCSASFKAYIIAVPESVNTCGRGYPTELSDNYTLQLNVIEESVEKLKSFIKKYQLVPLEEDPKWYLCSYWDE